MPVITAALAHDQSLCRADATGGAFERNWFIQNKVGADLKRLLHRGSAIDNGERYATAVGLTLPHLSQYRRAGLEVVAIDQERVIFAAGERQARLIGVLGQVKLYIGRVQNSPDSALNIGVATEEQSLQSHADKVADSVPFGQMTNVTTPELTAAVNLRPLQYRPR